MTLTEEQIQIARKLVTSFGAVSDCEMSLADVQWLTKNVHLAFTKALELAEKGNAEALRSQSPDVAKLSADLETMREAWRKYRHYLPDSLYPSTPMKILCHKADAIAGGGE